MIRNTLYIVSLSLLLVSSLSGRENPFVPTQEYLDEQTALMQPVVQSEEILPIENVDDGNRTVKIFHPKIKIKEEVKAKEIAPKPLEEIVVKKIIPVKKKAPKEIKTYKYNLLSFVKINIASDIMSIKTKYKLKKYFIFKQENKLVFDFVGKKRFYTKRETLSSHKDFERIIIGAHPEDYYFRVVIVPEYNASEYKIIIDKNRLITIKRMRK